MSEACPVVEVFCSYAQEDATWLSKLEAHLSLLKRQGFVSLWHYRLLVAGADWSHEIDTHLNTASIILLLISADFLNSDYCYGVEMQRALARHAVGEAQVIPILLRPVDHSSAPFAHLHALPSNGQPISTWSDEDAALADVVAGLRRVLEYLFQFSTDFPRTTLPAVWNIPYPRNAFFTGREVELQTIETMLGEHKNAAIGQTQAISGLGGIGKTQLAIEYAYRHRRDYRYVFWVLADTHETLNAAYSQLAHLLNLPAKNLAEQRLVIEAVKHWLTENQNWLLILDNADDLTVIRDFLPPTPLGQILLTTRAHAMGGLAERIEIKQMSEDEATRFLLRRSGVLGRQEAPESIDFNELTNARALVHELGFLPLALDQAGAYIEETSCGLQGYLMLYQRERKKLLQTRGGLVVDHPQPVATTWKLAFEKVEKANPSAADLLRLCAFLAPDDIPESILVEGEPELTGLLKKLARHPSKLNAAIAELQKYSLVSRNPVAKTLVMHRLVQTVLKDTMMKNVERAWAVRAVKVMSRTFPWPQVTTWDVCRRLLPHARSCADLMEKWQMDMLEGAFLLYTVGSYLDDRGEYHEAQTYYERTLAIDRKMLGEDNIVTSNCLNNLGVVNYNQGKYIEAKTYLQQALAIRRKLLGEEHPETTRTLNNLANVHDDQGKYEEAKALYQQALAIRRKVLREEHPEIADTMNNLADVYCHQNSYEEAEKLYQQALAIRRRELREDHPDIAVSLLGLGNVYHHQGTYEEAEKLYQQAFAICTKVLSKEHPYAATCLNNLANVYLAQGKYEEAEDLYQQALAIYAKVLRKEHPDTAISLLGLANVYFKQNRYEDAISFYQQALTISQEKLGPDHPRTKSLHAQFEKMLEEKGRKGEES
jgi:tetratricopeptide (TPR) repeat protein